MLSASTPSSRSAVSSSAEREQRHSNKKDVWAMTLLWSSLLVVSAVLFAWIESTTENNHQEDPALYDRLLWDSSSTADSSTPHHVHRPVYNEEHAPLFPLTRSDVIGFTAATLGLMIAAGGGIGGGGMLVPIYILLLGFSPKHAIPLSNVTVFGGAMANTLLNTRKRHPLADRPLIDYDLILVMEPLTIAGALIGAFLNKVLPELFLTVLLVVLLSLTAYNSLKKAFRMYQKESLAILRERQSQLTRQAKEQQVEDEEEAQTGLVEGMEITQGEEEEQEEKAALFKQQQPQPPAARSSSAVEKNTMTSRELKLHDLLEQERTTPMLNVIVLVVLFVVIIIMNLLKGGGDDVFPSPLGIKCGSTAFWLINGAMLMWIFLIALFSRAYLVRRFHFKEQCGYPYVEGDIKWDERATVVYPVICCLAGFFAGMFGIGGGIVKGPLMLAMGVHPAVSSASSACMILFTSFTATTSFIVFGLLVPDYALVCLCLGFVATIVGQVGLGYIMRRAKRNSYIAFSIGAVVLLSAFLMTIQSMLSMAAGEKHHAGGICGKGD